MRETPGIQIVLYGGQEEPYRDLELGRTDAVLLDSVIASRYGLTKPGLELGDPDVARGTYVIAVRLGETELRDALDGALADLMSRGELESIFAKYHLPPQPASGAGAPAQTQARFDAAQVLLFLRGAAVTLLVSILAMALAVPLGLLLALARVYGRPLARDAACAFGGTIDAQYARVRPWRESLGAKGCQATSFAIPSGANSCLRSS